jgi:hypothetical protein
MSRRVHDVPFVVGSDGTVFVNVLHCFTGAPSPAMLLKRACSERGRLLVAVELNVREVRTLLGRLGHGAAEAVAFAEGHRRRLATRSTQAPVTARRPGGRAKRSR